MLLDLIGCQSSPGVTDDKYINDSVQHDNKSGSTIILVTSQRPNNSTMTVSDGSISRSAFRSGRRLFDEIVLEQNPSEQFSTDAARCNYNTRCCQHVRGSSRQPGRTRNAPSIVVSNVLDRGNVNRSQHTVNQSPTKIGKRACELVIDGLHDSATDFRDHSQLPQAQLRQNIQVKRQHSYCCSAEKRPLVHLNTDDKPDRPLRHNLIDCSISSAERLSHRLLVPVETAADSKHWSLIGSRSPDFTVSPFPVAHVEEYTGTVTALRPSSCSKQDNKTASPADQTTIRPTAHRRNNCYSWLSDSTDLQCLRNSGHSLHDATITHVTKAISDRDQRTAPLLQKQNARRYSIANKHEANYSDAISDDCENTTVTNTHTVDRQQSISDRIKQLEHATASLNVPNWYRRRRAVLVSVNDNTHGHVTEEPTSTRTAVSISPSTTSSITLVPTQSSRTSSSQPIYKCISNLSSNHFLQQLDSCCAESAKMYHGPVESASPSGERLNVFRSVDGCAKENGSSNVKPRLQLRSSKTRLTDYECGMKRVAKNSSWYKPIELKYPVTEDNSETLSTRNPLRVPSASSVRRHPRTTMVPSVNYAQYPESIPVIQVKSCFSPDTSLASSASADGALQHIQKHHQPLLREFRPVDSNVREVEDFSSIALDDEFFIVSSPPHMVNSDENLSGNNNSTYRNSVDSVKTTDGDYEVYKILRPSDGRWLRPGLAVVTQPYRDVDCIGNHYNNSKDNEDNSSLCSATADAYFNSELRPPISMTANNHVVDDYSKCIERLTYDGCEPKHGDSTYGHHSNNSADRMNRSLTKRHCSMKYNRKLVQPDGLYSRDVVEHDACLHDDSYSMRRANARENIFNPIYDNLPDHDQDLNSFRHNHDHLRTAPHQLNRSRMKSPVHSSGLRPSIMQVEINRTDPDHLGTSIIGGGLPPRPPTISPRGPTQIPGEIPALSVRLWNGQKISRLDHAELSSQYASQQKSFQSASNDDLELTSMVENIVDQMNRTFSNDNSPALVRDTFQSQPQSGAHHSATSLIRPGLRHRYDQDSDECSHHQYCTLDDVANEIRVFKSDTSSQKTYAAAGFDCVDGCMPANGMNRKTVSCSATIDKRDSGSMSDIAECKPVIKRIFQLPSC